eukprot:4207825-Pyramimonas_sp.AAC.1
MPVIRTYCSGWLTATRIKYAGGSRPCIFGCRGHADRQYHYMRCRPLWTAVYQALGYEMQPLLPDRLGLRLPDLKHIETLAVAFNIYHNVRFRLYVTSNDLRSSARAAVRNLRLAKPDAQLQKKRQPPEALTLHRLPQQSSTSSTSSSSDGDDDSHSEQHEDPFDDDGMVPGSHEHTSRYLSLDSKPCVDTDGVRCSGSG